MDDLDRAQMNEEREREAAALLRKPTLKSIGYCHYCSEDLPIGMLFCGVECRDGWQELENVRKINGKIP